MRCYASHGRRLILAKAQIQTQLLLLPYSVGGVKAIPRESRQGVRTQQASASGRLCGIRSV